MRYTLWSRGRLLGHTDLDIHTVTPTMRQGFIEPAEDGRPLLQDATCVWRAMAERKRAIRARGGVELPEDDHLVMAAMRRRDALDFELRDENDQVFECEFMRIYDLFDIEAGVVEEMGDTEEEQEAEFEVFLSGLSPEERSEAIADRAQREAEIEEWVAEMEQDWEEKRMFQSSWPPPPPDDPRWDTMQYHLQVHLKGCFEHGRGF
jgi:hypothetical protein